MNIRLNKYGDNLSTRLYARKVFEDFKSENFKQSATLDFLGVKFVALSFSTELISLLHSHKNVYNFEVKNANETIESIINFAIKSTLKSRC